MQNVIYIKQKPVKSLLESEDMAMLHILMEDYEEVDIIKYMNSLNEANGTGAHVNGGVNSDKQTRLYKTAGFLDGFVKSLPSILTSIITYGVSGTALMAIGALHTRYEEKYVKKNYANPKAFADWLATFGKQDGDNKNGAADASIMGDSDSSTDSDKQMIMGREVGDRNVGKKIKEDVEKNTKIFYVENSNHEVQRVYAFDKNEAMEQAKILCANNKTKYSKMNELFRDGAHTYRIVYNDNSVLYLTALDMNSAKDEATKTAAALTKLYRTMGIPNVTDLKMKDITDEGMVELKIPEVLNVYETAPDPNTLKKLEQKTYPEFYTNDAGDIKTYKLRANYTTFYYPAASDDQARKIAQGFERVLVKQKGDLLNFISGSTDGMKANRIYMADGDSYVICTTKNAALTAEDKALRIMKQKYRLLQQCADEDGGAMRGLLSSPNKKTIDIFKNARSRDDSNKEPYDFPILNHKCAADIVKNTEEDIPAKFRNHHAVSVVRMENGHEGPNIYTNEIMVQDDKDISNSSSYTSKAV